MSLLVLKIALMAVLVAGGSVTLKLFADNDSLFLFTLSLSLYMAGTAIMGELLRGGMPLGTLVLLASIFQLVLVQLVSVFTFGEPFRGTPVLIALLAVFLLMQPNSNQ